MKIYSNINLLIAKKDIPKIKKQLDEQIPEIINEFNLYYKTSEEIKIKYNFVEYQKGFECQGQLYFGNKLIKTYEHIDLLFLDIHNMILNILKDIQNN